MDPVALAAHGESLWHRLGLAALGIGWVTDGEVARHTRPSSPVFLGALSLRAGVPAARLARAVEPLAGGLAVRDAGHPLYRTLGFHDVGPTSLWWRPTHRAT